MTHTQNLLAVKCGTTIFILNLFFSKLFGRSCIILQYSSDTTGPSENLALYLIKRHNCSKLWKKINGRRRNMNEECDGIILMEQCLLLIEHLFTKM